MRKKAVKKSHPDNLTPRDPIILMEVPEAGVLDLSQLDTLFQEYLSFHHMVLQCHPIR